MKFGTALVSLPLRQSHPFRIMAVSTFIVGVGNGVFAATSFLFFTAILEFDALFVGASLTAVGVLGIAFSALSGRHLERVDLSRANGAVLILQSVSTAALSWTRSEWYFLVMLCIAVVTSKYKIALRGTFIAVAFQSEGRTAARAWFRALSNGGMALGGVLAGGVMMVGTKDAYALSVAACGILYLAAGTLFFNTRLRGIRVRSESGQPDKSTRFMTFRDRPYLYMAVLNGLLGVHYLLIQIGLPLWTSEDPRRTVWVISMALVINTVVIVVAQVPLARFVKGYKAAIKAQVVAGLAFFAACVLIFFAGDASRVAQITFIACAAVVYSLGEILQASSSWELSFEMANPNHPGRYQALFATCSHIGPTLGPVALTVLLTAFPNQGWLVLAAFLVLLAFLHLPLANSAPLRAESQKAWAN